MQTPSTREIAGDTDVRDTERGRFEREPEPEQAPERDREEATAEEQSSTTAEERPTATADRRDDSSELLASDDNEQFRRRWESIQTGFVDEPRETVEQADELVAQVMKRVAEGFATERERLEQQWGRGEDVSTEDLRVSLQRYRGFFERLLSA
jgi:hypothetical protein